MVKKNLIGSAVRRLRMEQGKTQQAMAEDCEARGWDLSRAGLSKIEAGIRRVNDAELLLLSDILDVDVDVLWGLKSGKTKKERGAAATAALSVARHGRDS